MRINTKKWMGWAGVVITGFLLLFYQNCAPPSSNPVDEGDVPPPNVIDDVNLTTGVSFVQKSMELQASNLTFEAEGICSQQQSGARLSWELTDDPTNAWVDGGSADCDSGGFRIVVADSQKLACDQPYRIKAQLGFGDAGIIEVIRRCAPAAAKAVVDIDRAKRGIRCFMERSTEGRCEKACYRTAINVLREAADINSCD